MRGTPYRKRPNRRVEDDDDGRPAAKRQFTETDQKLARLYEQLADNSLEVRIRAAKELLEITSPGGVPDEENAKKPLTRLIRGLCSGREAARAGFFMTLTELVRQMYAQEEPFMELKDLVKLIRSSTDAVDSGVGQVSVCTIYSGC
jgi:DNA polymerase phi